jgi:hypothetical protein
MFTGYAVYAQKKHEVHLDNKQRDKNIAYSEKINQNEIDYISLFNDDEDGDGVSDFKDECHQTPSGVKVDKKGCPLDEDKDMIPDYRDKELNTPKNMIANGDGIGITKKMQSEWINKYNAVNKITKNPTQNTLTKTQNKKSIKTSDENLKKIMDDSLWKCVYEFCSLVEKYLNKNLVTQNDVDCFLNYVYQNMLDSVQSSTFCIPEDFTRIEAIDLVKRQTEDLINKKCVYEFKSWDGWDGKTPFVGFDFNISHDDYVDQFLVIVNTKNKISSIFSVNSKL